MADKLKQKGGANSQQIQAETAIIGIDEQRARQIYYELFDRQVKDLAYEASVIAAQRIGVFEGKIINRLEKIESAFENFRDPEFLSCIQSAENTAMQTDDAYVYDVLAELLAHKIQRKNEKKIGTGIKKAIQIVHDIDDDSLCGLTCYYTHQSFSIVTTNGKQMLEGLEKLFSKIVYSDLPISSEWLDQLDVLSCIRISPFATTRSFEDDLIERYEGILCNGIEKTSSDYQTAISILNQNKMPINILVDYEFAKNTVRMKVMSEASIDELKLNVYGKQIELTLEQKAALKKIYGLCKKGNNRVSEIRENLSKSFENYKYLSKVKHWINEMKTAFVLTGVGRVLAYTNAKRYEPNLPNMY
ncbi:MAG: hypothetical protein NC310_09100 [Roseburia sp.]|nr:hypothetical protein [Roseburia sp.]